jgi:NADPH:quinone reductase-like Zn-dependent oxidoreductase
VIGRGEVDDISGRPLLRSQWAGGIDTVGGNTLATILKATRREGSVAACGLVSSNQLTTSVFPFILNGVNLLGIDSATCPMPLRQQIWELLANEWRLYHLEEICHFYPLEEIEGQIEAMLKGQVRGRVVVEIA